MRGLRLVPVALLVLVVLPGCGDDDDTAAPPTTGAGTEPGAVDVCARARASIGATDPPADLVALAADAARIADAATAPDEPLRSALAEVSDAAVLLTEAARSRDTAAVAEAAGTLADAYDTLDGVAGDLGRPDCSSSSWGRHVATAAIDLSAAGG